MMSLPKYLSRNIPVYHEVTCGMVIVITRKQRGERKGLNTICKFCWVSLLDFGLGVTTTQLPEIVSVN